MATGLIVAEFVGHAFPVWSVAFSPDGRYLASAGLGNIQSGRMFPGDIKLWDIARRRELRRIDCQDHIWGVAFSTDGRHLASGGRDFTVRLWTLGQQGSISPPILLRGHEDEVRALAFSPDGHWLVSAGASGTVRRWNLHLGELKRLACEKAGRLTRDEWQEFFGTEAYHPICPELPSEQ